MKKEKFFPIGIFLAGMLGGIVRFQISSWLPSSPDFPWGTLVVIYLLLSIGGGLLFAYCLGRKKW